MCMHNAEAVLQFTIKFINMAHATQVHPTIKTVWTEGQQVYKILVNWCYVWVCLLICSPIQTSSHTLTIISARLQLPYTISPQKIRGVFQIELRWLMGQC